ncbi:MULTISPECIES: response regulator [Kocuria]|uniref:LuxR family transcriptional regulator n=1 Tax=Kocuria rosea subsp. polaris TaxID=136273 RepID=A0A0W8IPI0_KOCRO|nr:response regulator transcription factor [Kocuria polaris]KUG61675.1 LuxR family transcriptional regulator [Kocuria polaris]
MTRGTEPAPVRVLLVDDEAMVRSGLAMLLTAEPDLIVVGEAADGAAAVEETARLQPDVVVMDVRMPGTDGVAATRVLTSDAFLDRVPNVATVLMLTTFDEDAAVHAALRAGASGFILKSSAPKVLADAVRSLARGGGWLDPDVTRRLLTEFSRHPDPAVPPPEQLQQLTRREREVLVAVAHGLTNTEIARRLFLSEATVKTHVHRIFLKLGVSERAQAVTAAFKSGLVKPTDSF